MTRSTIVEITLPYQAFSLYAFRFVHLQQQKLHYLIRLFDKVFKALPHLQQQKLHYLIRLMTLYITLTSIYNSRNYITLLGIDFLKYSRTLSTIVEITLPYQARKKRCVLTPYLQQQKLHYLIRLYIVYVNNIKIYNSRNYITLLGVRHVGHRHDIYNSRNYITLLGYVGWSSLLLDLQQQKLHYLIRPRKRK